MRKTDLDVHRKVASLSAGSVASQGPIFDLTPLCMLPFYDSSHNSQALQQQGFVSGQTFNFQFHLCFFLPLLDFGLGSLKVRPDLSGLDRECKCGANGDRLGVSNFTKAANGLIHSSNTILYRGGILCTDSFLRLVPASPPGPSPNCIPVHSASFC
jgi:hypothetical protein